ncbi:MAG: LysR family transcriptional regulator [Pseudomonadota bacterium]
MDWDDLRYVLEADRQNGLSGAARVLGVNHATVARRIVAAEDALGATLFDRLPTGYRATQAGREAVKTALLMETAGLDLERTIGSRDQVVAGELTVTAPQLMIGHVLAPILRDFGTTYPEIQLKVLGSNETLNLARREADVAIRISNTPHETLFGRMVAEQKSCVYASESYLRALSQDPDRRLAWLRFEHWTGIIPEVRALYPNVHIAMAFDDMAAMLAAVQTGIGVTRMPCFIGDQTKGVVRLPDVPLMPYLSVWVLTHVDLRKVARIATFMQFVGDRLQQLRPVFVGAPAEGTDGRR